MYNVQLIVDIDFEWNNEPGEIHTQEAYVGVYNENKPDTDAFYWFNEPSEILGDSGEFTVLDYKITDARDSMLLKKLEEYDDYMTTKIESEGYCIPVSLKEFLEMQVNPIALSNLNFKNKRDIMLFERVRDLYLKHSVEVMEGTELYNAPVCYAEWLQYEGLGDDNA